MKRFNVKTTVMVLLTILSFCILQSCQPSTTSTQDTQSENANGNSARNQSSQDSADAHLKTFDELDFDVFSNQKWDRLHVSHAQNIKVYWPDGRLTEDINTHIDDMKKMFVFAPDTRIKQHPIRIATDKYTAVTGVFEGTFTKPMPIGNGKFIQPTGKAFKLPMCTVGIWENGVMVEEHLFWDNDAFAKQIGLK